MKVMPRPHLPPRKRQCAQCAGSWVGPQGLAERARKIFHLMTFDPRNVNTVANRCRV